MLPREVCPRDLTFDAKSSQWQSADTTVLSADATAQTYYVIAYADSLSGGAANFTITAEALAFSLSFASPGEIGNTGNVTLKLEGGQLADDLTYQIVDSEDTATVAGSVYVVDSTTVYATFDTTGLPVGTYDVEVVKSGYTVALYDVVEVVPGVAADVEVHLSAPDVTRPGWTSQVVIDYRNTGNVDMVAPLMLLTAPGANLAWPGESTTYSTMLLMGISPEGPAGILSPGQAGSITLEATPGTGVSEIDFTLSTIADPSTQFDWDSFKNDYAPEASKSSADSVAADTAATTSWDSYFDAFKSAVGETAGSWQDALATYATRLGQMGERVYDAATLTDCTMAQVDPTGEMLLRGTEGALGKLWPDITEFAATVGDDGYVTVNLGGNERYYAPQSDGSFLATNGDRSVVTEVGGVFRLEEWDGMVALFHADGSLNYIESPEGNRTTASYSDGRIVTLDRGLGAVTSFAYDSDGRLITKTDPTGRSVSYSYDSEGYLIRMDLPGGYSASMTYAESGPAVGAVTSMSFSDGETLEFEYDSQGRLVKRAIGDTFVALTYDGTGGTIMTDASGRETSIWRDQYGQVRRIVDDTGAELRFTYDASHRLTSVTESGTVTKRLYYDADGNLSTIVDACGNRTELQYDSDYQLVSAQDAIGSMTAYTYDAQGHLVAKTYADGTSERMTYDSRGRMTSLTNRRGETVSYAYDAQRDLLTGKSYGSYSATYTYNSVGDLLTATDNNGTTSMEYNAAGLLTKITYPAGQWLEFMYDETGHRAQMTDQDGYTVKYEYNELNMISRVASGDGSTIARYTYDTAGLLERKDLGNGQYTTYTYDGAGHLLGLYNHASDGTVVSKYEYVYDVHGRRVSMTTLDGVYSYTYDLKDQLTSVTTPGGRTIQYAYDAMGNRLAVNDGGTTTSYSINSLSQYTSVGSTSLSYDADGNLVSKSDGGQNWSYTYDAEGRIVAATTPSDTVTYEYDALGNRVSSTLNGVRTDYLLDPFSTDTVFAEFDATGEAIARYPRGYGLLGRSDGSGNDSYYHFDGSGNAVELVDAAGDALNSYEYLPFGETLSSSETVHNPFLFAGEQGIVAVGNGEYFANVRQYDPQTGRFLSCDWQAQPAANPYTYAGNQPNMRYDSNGFADDAYTIGSNFISNVSSAGALIDTFTDAADSSALAAWAAQNLNNMQILHLKGLASADDVAAAAKLVKQLEASPLTQAGGSVLDAIGTVGDAATVLDAGVTLKDVVQGKKPAYELIRNGALLVCIPISKMPPTGPQAPLVYVAKNIGLWDLATNWAANEYYGNNNTKPTDELFTNPDRVHEAEKAAARRRARLRQHVVNGIDPNDILGPAGYGDSNWIAPQQVLPYTIRFENDAQEATAPAQQVVITETLDEDLDLSTFELTGFGFGETTHSIAAGLSDYQTQIDLSDTHNVVVDVDIDLDVASRLVTWTFTSLDPTTLQPTKDPLAGFLPPNETSPEGEGWVAYRVESDSASTSGTTIDAQARIVFDVNDPIDTNLWTNTIDAAAPTSQVTELPGDGLGSSVLVSWSGSDEGGSGSGIAGYDIYVSKDDGPYTLWLAGTQDTSATFSGSGISTYRFYSAAIDNVGNREAAPETVDAEATFLDQWFTGTAGDDTFEFIAAATNDAWIVRLNDVLQAVDSRAIGVYFDGLDGNDTVTFTGTEADDVAELHPTSATLSADAYTATGVNVETVAVIGAGGFDVASLYDSAGDDTLDMYPDVTYFSGDGFAQTVSDFSVVHAYARGGGTDTASMYDSAGDDTFKADPQYAKLYGDGFYNRAKFFEVVHAYAKAGGNDTARLYDSAWNDQLVATPEFAKMYNSRYYRRAKFFETSIVYANAGGTDVARLYDSKGSDRLVATPYETRLYDTAGTYDVTARRFDAALVYATGGSDIARFYDSAGDDRLVTTPSQVRLNDTAGTYDVTALRFDAAVVYGSGGTDTAELHGRAGAIDVFRGRSNKSTYYGAGYDYTIRDFETVSAYGNQDERDVAKLHDTAGDDHLTASGNQATLARSDGSRTLYHVFDFPTVRAYSTTGADTTEIEAAVDFLMLEGGWQD